MIAPTTPSTMAPKIPPFAGLGSIRFAIKPTTPPNKIQKIMFILFTSFEKNIRTAFLERNKETVRNEKA